MMLEQLSKKHSVLPLDLANTATQDFLRAMLQSVLIRKWFATDDISNFHGLHGTSLAFSTFAVATIWSCTFARTHC